MKKKVVFLPYDMDTALGINNEGALVFSYNLEDIDQIEGGADVYNGQQSVLWKNMRDAFFDDMKEMYQGLRSSGAISYDKVKQMFEEHQAKWPEAIFNDDAWFKYIDPLIEKGNASYLSMLQGSKEGQRNWWMYYRFRYLDSKYNAGDSLKDFITLRGYAKANIKLTPYADVYPSVKFGSYLVQLRGKRGNEYEIVCPLDNLNDTEIYIYDASLLSSVGDLSGLKVGYADFSKATKLLDIKLGDGSESYQNGNMKEFYAGNNTLLQKVDLRNCNQLSQAVDLSGCTNIEYVYFDGTIVTGIKLPNGGILKVLHLPSTITNLEILNQPMITELVIPSYANIGTLRLENVGNIVDSLTMIKTIAAGSRVRVIGFNWSFNSVSEINTFYDLLDTMRGLDENGNNVDKAQLMGTVHVDTITGSEMSALLERYPNISITYNHISSYLYYYNYDGTTLLFTETITDGGDGVYIGQPSRNSTAQYSYTFAGWSRTPNGEAESDARLNVEADRNVYAAYTATIRTYSVTFVNSSSGSNVTLQTVSNVPYGGNATYTEATPVDAENGMDFLHWNPEPTNITGNTTCYAVFESPLEVAEISDSWADIIASINDGTYRTKYKVGNYKPLDLGSEGIINMQISGFNKETLADGSGTAPISWIGKELLNTNHRMNPALVTNYVAKEVNSFSSNIFTDGSGEEYRVYISENRKVAGAVAKATWTITNREAGTFELRYKTMYDNANNELLKIIVNDGIIVQDYVNSSLASYTKEVQAGEVITVQIEYTQVRDNNDFYCTINIMNNSNLDVSMVNEKTQKKVFDSYQEGTGMIGRWETYELSQYLEGTIKPLIPEEVRNAIKEVQKKYKVYDTTGNIGNIASNTYLWLPDYSNDIFKKYKVLFSNAGYAKRKPNNNIGSLNNSYWLVEANSVMGLNQTHYIGYDGNISFNTITTGQAVLLCFCM